MSEVVTGFVVIASLVVTRAFMLPFVYWNMLRMRFASPEASAHHQQAWRSINAAVAPLLDKVPALQRPLGWARDWFTKPARQAQGLA